MPDRLNDSYYRATADAWETQCSLGSALDCDVVVIGGGFTGLSAALACAEKGLSVVLLEAQTIGFGASGRNGGQLIPGLRWSMQEIDAEFGREQAQAIFDLAWSAGARVHDRIEKHNINCDLKSGHLEAAFKPAHFDDMKREAEFLSREFGWESIKVVAPEDMGDHINGGGYHGGVYDPKGGHFHPLNYALGLAKAALQAGVRIYENTAARAPTDKGSHVEITAGAGLVSAKHVVIAADNWTGDIAPELESYAVPIMNYNIATASLPHADQLLPSDAAIADSRFVLNYFRLSADKRLIFGGGEKYVQQPPSDIAAFVRKHMVQVFPSLAQTPIDFAWGGAVGVTMNRLPHIGRKGNIFYAHGFSGHGALVTTLTGELMAEAVVGTMSRFDVFANLPHSRFPGGKWLARPLATLGLLYYAMRDRL
ncbi:MAG: FAD-dependent oxidoreductase [Sphingomonadales bacterium 17-56-6]|nr:MAG: FAD-dependent oxidoreductase [Sphingomonadales bacterium 28-55-16]OYZ86788.1 MAG: FAD-dependent oxidoreductase [Sphingomonadales bacterium 17-56-6]